LKIWAAKLVVEVASKTNTIRWFDGNKQLLPWLTQSIVSLKEEKCFTAGAKPCWAFAVGLK